MSPFCNYPFICETTPTNIKKSRNEEDEYEAGHDSLQFMSIKRIRSKTEQSQNNSNPIYMFALLKCEKITDFLLNV